ncbi:MAG: FAD-dependent oxidoreductase [Butyricicoccus sp.]
MGRTQFLRQLEALRIAADRDDVLASRNLRRHNRTHADRAAAEHRVGAKPIVPPIPGIDSSKVVGLDALHQAEPAVGQKVVILGGGLVGSECAIYLDSLGKDVTVVEMKDDWASDAYFMHKNAMNIYLRDSKVQIHTNTTAKSVTEEGLLCSTADGDLLLEADTILLAAGMKPDRELADSFYNAAPRVFQVGDCIKAGRVLEAVTLGYYRALDI